MSYKYAFFFLDCQILMPDLQKIDCPRIFRFPGYCLIRKKNPYLCFGFARHVTVYGKQNAEAAITSV